MNKKAVIAAGLDVRVWILWIVNVSSLAGVCFPLLFVTLVIMSK